MANRFGIPQGLGQQEAQNAPGLRGIRPEQGAPGLPSPDIRTPPSEFGKAVVRGVGTLAAGLARGTGAVARAAGQPGLAEAPESFADRVERDLVAPNAGRVSRLSDIRTDDTSAMVDDMSDYLSGLVGSQLPVFGSMLVGGAAGAAVGRGAGALAGATGVSAGLQAGEAAGSIQQDLGRPLTREEAGVSLGAGTMGAAFDVLPVVRAARTLGVGRPLQSAIKRSLLSRAGREATQQALLEGSTEGLQQVIQRGARRFVNDNFDMLGPEGVREILESAGAGAILGAGLGGLTGALSRPEVANPSEDDLVDQDIEDIAAEEELREAERTRLVGQLRGVEGVSDEYLASIENEPFVDELLLDELRARVPAGVKEQADLDFATIAEEDPQLSIELAIAELVEKGGELSRREASAAASAFRTLAEEDPAALTNILRDTAAEVGPEQMDRLNAYVEEVLGEGKVPTSGDLGSSLSRLEEGGGDTLVDYFGIKTRLPNQGEWVGDNNTGGFFRDSPHVHKAIASLERRNTNTRYERVPAREIVEGELGEDYEPRVAQRLAVQELEARVADTQDPLTREQVDRVREVARAFMQTGEMPEGVGAKLEGRVRKLVEDPLSVFDGRFAIVPTSAPQAFSGTDPFELSADKLRPDLTREQKQERSLERAKVPLDSKEDKTIMQRFRQLRDRKAIVRTPTQNKRNPNAREFVAQDNEGRARFIFAPNLVRQMVRAQRRLSGREFNAFFTPQEVIDGFMLGLAELNSQGFNVGVIPDSTQVWERRTAGIAESITWGEIRSVGMDRLIQRGKSLSERIEDAGKEIVRMREAIREGGLAPDRKAYYKKQIKELETLRKKGPSLLTQQREFFSRYRDASQAVVSQEEMTEIDREATVADMEALGEGIEVDLSENEQLVGEEATDFLDVVDERVNQGEGGFLDEHLTFTRDEPSSETLQNIAAAEPLRQEHEAGRLVGEAIAAALPGARVREAAELRGADFDAAVRELGEAPTHQQDKRQVKAWAKALGLPDDTKLMSTAEVLQLLRERGDIGRIHRIRNGSLNGLSIDNSVWVHPALEPGARLEVLAHEMGHVIAANTAPHNSDAVYDAWVAWRKEQDKPGTLVRDVAQSKQAFFTAMRNFGRLDSEALSSLNAEERAYVLDFEEWFADQVSRHLAGQPSPNAEIRGWMDRFIEAIKKLFGLVREGAYTADASVQEFLTRMVHRDDVVSWRVREAAEASGNPQSLYATLIANDVGSHTSFWATYRFLQGTTPSLRATLGRAFASDGATRRKVIRALRAQGHYNEAYQARTTLNSAVAYGLQLWAHGLLEVGPRAEGALGRLRDAVFTALGEVSEPDQIANALDAVQHDQGSAWVISKVRKDTSLQKSAQAVKELWDRWMGPLVDRIVWPAFARLEQTGIPSLIELSRMFHSPAGEATVQEGYLAAKSKETSAKLDQLHRVFGKKPPAELLQEVHTAMQRGEQATSEEGQRAQAKLRTLLNDMFKYLNRGGQLPPQKFRKDYYPQIWDVEALQDHAQEWRDKAANPAYTSMWQGILNNYQNALDDYNKKVDVAKQANIPLQGPNKFEQRALDIEAQYGSLTIEGVIEATFRGLNNEYGTNELDLEFNETGHNPFVAARNTRVLDLLTKAGPHQDFFVGMLSKDLDHTMRSYIQSAVKRTELDRLGGVERVRGLIRDADFEGASWKQLQLASDFTEAMQGTLGHQTALWIARLFGMTPPEPGTVIDPRIQKVQSAIMLWQNFRVLALAGFTSLADPVGILVRGGGLDSTLAGIKGMQAGSYPRQVAEGLGIISTYSINEALGGIYGSNYMVGKTQAWNEKFFKWTGLELITRATRTMATGTGLSFIKSNVDNQRMLDELGLESEDVVLNDAGEVKVLTRYEVDSLYDQRSQSNDPQEQRALTEEIERNSRIRAAINKFVDEAVLRPTAATRPIWASDPHAALLFHLKSFIYTFHSQILRRVWREGVQHGNMTPLLLLSVYVPFMIGADVLRDIARYGTGGDPRKENWTTMDWVEHGVERAGLPGLATYVLDAQQDREWGGLGIESALGPTVNSLFTLVDDVVLGDSEQAYRGLLEQLPGSNTPMVDALK